MVPEGWQKKKLGEVATLQRGFDLPTRERIDGKYPIISSGGLTGYHNEFKVQSPGVVTGRYGTIGDVFFIEEDFWPLNTSLWVKDFYCNDRLFVYYLLSNFDFQKLSDKTGVPGVNRNDAHAINVLLPPLTEQRKIAAILSTWDAAIEKQAALIRAKEQRKRALMQQLLTGKTRFKEFEGQAWQSANFDDMFIIDIGGTPARKESAYWDTDFETRNHWVSISDLQGKYISATQERISDLGVEKSNVKLFPAGTVVMSFKLTIGRAAILEYPMYTNEAICALIPKNAREVDTEYLYQALAVVDFDQEIDQAVKGKTLNKAKIKRLRLALPPLPEQQKIASVLSTADREIRALQTQLGAYKEQKRGLMQRLLTGKTQVRVPQETEVSV